MEKLAKDSANKTERETWIRQFADTVSAAYESGAYPQGVQRLRSMLGNLKSGRDSEDLIASLTFRYHTADYSRSLQVPNALLKDSSEMAEGPEAIC